jgi:hypothetical protein
MPESFKIRPCNRAAFVIGTFFLSVAAILIGIVIGINSTPRTSEVTKTVSPPEPQWYLVSEVDDLEIGDNTVTCCNEYRLLPNDTSFNLLYNGQFGTHSVTIDWKSLKNGPVTTRLGYRQDVRIRMGPITNTVEIQIIP